MKAWCRNDRYPHFKDDLATNIISSDEMQLKDLRIKILTLFSMLFDKKWRYSTLCMSDTNILMWILVFSYLTDNNDSKIIRSFCEKFILNFKWILTYKYIIYINFFGGNQKHRGVKDNINRAERLLSLPKTNSVESHLKEKGKRWNKMMCINSKCMRTFAKAPEHF